MPTQWEEVVTVNVGEIQRELSLKAARSSGHLFDDLYRYITRKLSQTDRWKAGCRESGKSGSERGAKDNVLCPGRTRAASPMRRALLLLYSFSALRAPRHPNR